MARWKFKLPTLWEAQWDPWLQRASHIAQVLGVIIALAALFYAVVPLYRMAALDKQILDQQQELDRIQRELAASYGRLRSRIAWEAIFKVGPPCTGLMEPPPEPGYFTKSLADAVRGQRQVEPEPPWDRNLSSDVQGCMLNAVSQQSSLDQLKAQDKAAFLSEFRTAVDAIGRDQRETLERARTLPERARHDDSLLPPAADAETIVRWAYKGLSNDEVAAKVFEDRVNSARSQLEAEWVSRTTERLKKVSRMRWPE